jgi:hypothetical protein
MPRSLSLTPVSVRTLAVRAAIKDRPIVRLFATNAVAWDRHAAVALDRGDLNYAAQCQERAALAAHRLGLLEGALTAILTRHR